MHTIADAAEPTPARCAGCPAFRKILFVRADATMGADVKHALRLIGLPFQTTLGTRETLAQTRELDYELVVWDCDRPMADDLAALRELRRSCTQLPVIVLSNGSEADVAIELIKAG